MKFLRKIYTISGLLAALIISACGNEVSTEQMLTDARDSYVDGDYTTCRELCEKITTAKRAGLTEQQYGELAILFMKLSENENPEENTAEATKCYLEGMKLSADSMKAFMGSLAPEDLPHFVTVARLGSFMTKRPDLTEEYIVEDTVTSAATE